MQEVLIITVSKIALLQVAILMDSIVVVCGITLIMSTKLNDSIINKTDNHRKIKLLAINRILGKDEINLSK